MLDSVPRSAGATDDAKYGALTARIPIELLEELRTLARKEERSLNYITARLLREALDARANKP